MTDHDRPKRRLQVIPEDWTESVRIKRLLESQLDELVKVFLDEERRILNSPNREEREEYEFYERTIISVLRQEGQLPAIAKVAKERDCSMVVATAAVYAFGYRNFERYRITRR